ncbi:hypothetical protein [Pulveribacter suum]|uniref:hypothetical protein n=1 Tax=Pulveribacter suum TaxID=2116657 RepID=UPI001300A55B|nr:hypothetical protein [Pulveribacter suum]
MATTRPLMQLGIGDLEGIFEKESKSFATLDLLKQELSHRQVPRAVALLERVQKAEAAMRDTSAHRPDAQAPRSTLRLARGKPEAAPAPAPAQETPRQPVPKSILQAETAQQDLLAGFGQYSPKEPASGTAAEAIAPQKPVTPEPEAIPQLALEDAYRILKVAAGDSWEKVEAGRRKIVLKSSPLATKGVPSAQSQKLLVEAQMANDAAIVIAARRCGRH